MFVVLLLMRCCSFVLLSRSALGSEVWSHSASFFSVERHLLIFVLWMRVCQEYTVVALEDALHRFGGAGAVEEAKRVAEEQVEAVLNGSTSESAPGSDDFDGVVKYTGHDGELSGALSTASSASLASRQ